jgi:hypothetical protein
MIGGMDEPLDDPPPQRPQRYNSLQLLIGAAAGCILASFIAIGVVIWLAQSGGLSTESWQIVIKLLAVSPILGAVCGVLILARKGKHS